MFCLLLEDKQINYYQGQMKRMNIERLLISQKQIAELETEIHTTLYSDETSKFGKKYYGYHISTQEGQFYSLGFRQIVTKSDQDTYSCFQQLLSDIEEVSTSSTNDTAKIL